MTSKLAAIMDIGSTAIRLLIAEIHTDRTWKTLEQAAKSLPLGRDAFSRQRISAKTISTAVQIIKGYLELCRSWGIPPEEVMAIGTSALREAVNRDTVLERVRVATGVQVSVIDGIEENRLTYAAVEYALKQERKQLARFNSLIIEAGGGSTELMLLKRNKMVAAHSLKIGTIRTKTQLRSGLLDQTVLSRLINENIEAAKTRLDTELELKKVRFFVAVGGDVRVAAEHAGTRAGKFHSVIAKDRFISFIDEMETMSPEAIVEKLHIPYNMAELFGNSLVMYRLFLEGTSAEEIYVPTLSIREGVILTRFFTADAKGSEQLEEQMRASALAAGKKYLFDESHALHVTRLALTIFDFLKDQYKMPRKWRNILEIAGILHDIGTFIHTAGHHKHGQYIIEHTELFGLSSREVTLVANIVRHHRKRVPSASNISFYSLSAEDRILVLKLTGILRIADALDRSHAQRINNIRVSADDDCMYIESGYNDDVSIEKSSLKAKADLFEEVFGLGVRLT
ncbi:MAG: HD domain-containing protein [Spirochaetales bacterium]|nr:HD domain-containing protein [Spirochaetales bacterium]